MVCVCLQPRFPAHRPVALQRADGGSAYHRQTGGGLEPVAEGRRCTLEPAVQRHAAGGPSLRQDGFAEVRLADDSTGWIEATTSPRKNQPRRCCWKRRHACVRWAWSSPRCVKSRPKARAGGPTQDLRRAREGAAEPVAECGRGAYRGVRRRTARRLDAQRQLGELRTGVQSALQTLAEVRG